MLLHQAVQRGLFGAAWARDNMAAYKVPKLVEFVEALPKAGSGKVMWRQLQDQEAARSAALGG